MGLTNCKHSLKYGPDYWCNRDKKTEVTLCIRDSGKLCEHEEEATQNNRNQAAQTNNSDYTQCPKCGSGVIYTNDEQTKRSCCHCNHEWHCA